MAENRGAVLIVFIMGIIFVSLAFGVITIL